MSYFNDKLGEVIRCIENEETASVAEFFTELKRKIDNGFEIYSEFDLQLMLSDLNDKGSLSEIFSSTQLQRIILRSILKNNGKKISIDDLIRSVFESDYKLNIEKYIRNSEYSYLSLYDYGDPLISTINEDHKESLITNDLSKNLANNNDKNDKDDPWTNYMPLFIWGTVGVILSMSLYRNDFEIKKTIYEFLQTYVAVKKSLSFSTDSPSGEGSDAKSSDVEETNLTPVTQKIIWQWSGGGVTFLPGQALVGVVNNAACEKLSEDLDHYLQNGWEIQSTNSAERTVGSQVCIGRDIVISRE